MQLSILDNETTNILVNATGNKTPKSWQSVESLILDMWSMWMRRNK